jgi:DNA-binding transcriptional LysR family regulator
VQERKLQVLPVHTDEIKLLLPAGHPLARLESVRCEDMVGQTLLLPKGGATRAKVNAWLDPVSDRVMISMELDSTEMIKRFVLAGLGISFMAVSHFQEGLDAGQFAAVSLSPEPLIRRLGLVYRRDKAFSKAGLEFIQVVMDRAKQSVAQHTEEIGFHPVGS